MSVIKKPDLTDPKLRAKLAKGMGHNYYGEPAWPNDILYIFPITMLGIFTVSSVPHFTNKVDTCHVLKAKHIRC